MGLFKSREERKMEREIEIRKGINAIRRNLQNSEKYEAAYVERARQAKKIGANEQLNFIKANLKRTARQRRLLERQLLVIETAIQIKNQAESQAQFVKSLSTLSKAIALSFAQTDMATSQKEFRQALAQARSMEERMDVFLDMNYELMADGNGHEDLVTDAEIEQMISGNESKQEQEIDAQIAQELKEIERELRQ